MAETARMRSVARPIGRIEMKMLFLIQRHAKDATAEKLTYEYLVTKVINSILPPIGTVLSEAKCADYCNTDTWKVTIS